MADEMGVFAPAIAKVVEDIEALEGKLAEKKRIVNQLCEYAGRPPMYTEVQRSVKSDVRAIRGDLFYGKALASAIREYLEMRKVAGQGAATVNEIFDSLKAGGFKFDAEDDANAKRGLRQSLTKNSTAFHRLPNGQYGLVSWYPNIRTPREQQEKAEVTGAGHSAESAEGIDPGAEGSPAAAAAR